MIGLDTNVLVRFLVRDDVEQAERARVLIEGRRAEDPGFISLIVLVELTWVLRRTYDISASDVTAVIARLLDASCFVLQEADLVRRALRSTAELADVLIAELGSAAGCRTTVTFDRLASRHPAMTLI